MLVRLADASLGEPFTSGIEFERVDDATLDVFRLQFASDLVNMPNAFKMLGLEDYLRLAGRIFRYAVDLYRETGYPVQALQPFLPSERRPLPPWSTGGWRPATGAVGSASRWAGFSPTTHASKTSTQPST
jgi:hypothetical protein